MNIGKTFKHIKSNVLPSFQTELNLELLVKDEPIDWEETIDPSESLTIDHEIDIKPVRKIKGYYETVIISFDVTKRQ